MKGQLYHAGSSLTESLLEEIIRIVTVRYK